MEAYSQSNMLFIETIRALIPKEAESCPRSFMKSQSKQMILKPLKKIRHKRPRALKSHDPPALRLPGVSLKIPKSNYYSLNKRNNKIAKILDNSYKCQTINELKHFFIQTKRINPLP